MQLSRRTTWRPAPLRAGHGTARHRAARSRLSLRLSWLSVWFGVALAAAVFAASARAQVGNAPTSRPQAGEERAGAGRAETRRVEIDWWHAMPGELGAKIDRLAADFNASQDGYRIVTVYKGSYPEAMASAVAAFRARRPPHIVQVFEVGTATMVAIKDAAYPVHELMRDAGAPFEPGDYIPAVAAYYSDARGQLLSFPFNASTPVLYYNKDLFRRAGLPPDSPPRTWPDMEEAGRRLLAAGIPCGFTTEWPSWSQVETFAAWHNVPLASKANGFGGLDTELSIADPLLARHLANLARWQKTRLFDYGGRGDAAKLKFYSGECAMTIASSGARLGILSNVKGEVGVAMLPYYPDVPGTPRNSIIGGATLWVLRGRPEAEYKGVARFLAFLSRPDVQAWWHQETGYLPITIAAYRLSEQEGFYARNPGADVAIKQLTHQPPNDNSRGARLGNFVQIRNLIEDEIENVLQGQADAATALASAERRGNQLLRQFEAANR